jgi:hypothetical protein
VVVRRLTSALVPLLAVAVLLTAACSDSDKKAEDDPAALTTTSSTEVPSRDDPKLAPFLLTVADLPAGFAETPGTDSTVTSFCAGQDAVAGLVAAGRAYASFSRTPAGAAVLHLVFRFRKGDAATFVQQGRAILDTCSNVPDIRGLAFSYDDSVPAVEELFAKLDHVTRHGTSAGSGNLSEDVAMFRRGDIGELVAVLTNGAPRAETDALAVAAFRAAIRKAPES